MKIDKHRGRVFSEYCKADGVFTSQSVTGFRPADSETHGWRPGRYDHQSQRVDMQSDEVVAYAPPPPDDAPRRRRRALALIAELERKQLRPLRELVRNPTNAEARFRIDAIDLEIAELRSQL